MDFSLSTNPFAVLTFIAAPAILTNASSVMGMQTANRFARTIDRARQLSAQLPDETKIGKDEFDFHVWLLERAEQRALLLVRALTAFYIAVGSFAAATFSSLLGAAFHVVQMEFLRTLALGAGALSGVSGVGGLLVGSAVLVWETRRTVEVMSAQATYMKSKRATRIKTIDSGESK